jgi:regulator of RNase E activity RraB
MIWRLDGLDGNVVELWLSQSRRRPELSYTRELRCTSSATRTPNESTFATRRHIAEIHANEREEFIVDAGRFVDHHFSAPVADALVSLCAELESRGFKCSDVTDFEVTDPAGVVHTCYEVRAEEKIAVIVETMVARVEDMFAVAQGHDAAYEGWSLS